MLHVSIFPIWIVVFIDYILKIYYIFFYRVVLSLGQFEY